MTAAENSHDARPLHQRIAADLREEIMTSDLPPGGKVPSTERLKERFGVSNATVQKALRLLKDEGLVVGRAGASVTVRAHRQRTVRPASSAAASPTGEPYRWLADATGDGAARSTLLDVAEVRPPADVAAALGLNDGATAVRRRQVITVSDDPLELVHAYYPAEIALGTALAERRRIRGGAAALLAELGHPPRRCVDYVAARVPTREQYETLRLPGDLPVLRTLRIAYGDDDRPVEVSVMAKAGHLYELRYEFVPDDGSSGS